MIFKWKTVFSVLSKKKKKIQIQAKISIRPFSFANPHLSVYVSDLTLDTEPFRALHVDSVRSEQNKNL